jgi:membrane protein implicated in regulation of membrane protease activity
MNRRWLKIGAAAGAAAIVVALGGAALARATGVWDDGDSQLSGPQAEHAKRAALAITHGGTANAVERDSEQGATYEVEVTRPDGTTVDVRLDASFGLVAIEGDSESGDSGDG